MNINIQEIANEHIKSMEEKGIIEKTIQETLEKTILKAITDALDGYQLKRSIEEKISKEISNVVSDMGFTAYNSFIAQKVKEITEVVCNADIAQKIQKTFDKMLAVKRDSIKLSEIFAKYRDWICVVVDESEKYSLERFYVKFEKNEEYGWYNIELAKEKPTGSYSYDDNKIRFVLHPTDRKPGWGWIGRTYIDDLDIKKMVKFGHMSDVELLLVNLTYNETPIEIDVTHQDEIDDSYDVDI